MMNIEFTVESFGADCPANWREICEYLNEELASRIEALGIDENDEREVREVADGLWEEYSGGDLEEAPDPIEVKENSENHILRLGEYIPCDGNGSNPGTLKAVYSSSLSVDVSEEVYGNDDELFGTVTGYKDKSMSIQYLAKVLGVKHLWYQGEMLI